MCPVIVCTRGFVIHDLAVAKEAYLVAMHCSSGDTLA